MSDLAMLCWPFWLVCVILAAAMLTGNAKW